MPHLSLFNYIKKVSDNMNKSCLGIIIAIIISFFVIQRVSADEVTSGPGESSVESVEVVTSISVIESVEVVTSVSVIESIVTFTEPIQYTSAIVTTPDTRLESVESELESALAMLADYENETTSITSVPESLPSDIITSESENIVLTQTVQKLINYIDAVADQNDVDVVYPEDFELNVAVRIGFVMYDTYAAAHPDLYRDNFISDVLDMIAIAPEHDYYFDFYDAVALYYDEVTGLVEVNNDNAVDMLVLCSVGGIFIFTALKWIF